MNKKAQTFKLVTGLVFGIVGLIIAIIVAFLIISSVKPISTTMATDTAGTPVINESDTTGAVVYLNETGYTLAKSTETGFSNPRITAIWNVSESGHTYNRSVNTANASVTSAGVLSNATNAIYGLTNISVSYTYDYHASTDSVTRITGNLTGGVDKISAYVPTVLIIAGIVLLLTILAVLVGVWAKLKGGSGI